MCSRESLALEERITRALGGAMIASARQISSPATFMRREIERQPLVYAHREEEKRHEAYAKWLKT
jgi:hypothetical protein